MCISTFFLLILSPQYRYEISICLIMFNNICLQGVIFILKKRSLFSVFQLFLTTVWYFDNFGEIIMQRYLTFEVEIVIVNNWAAYFQWFWPLSADKWNDCVPCGPVLHLPWYFQFGNFVTLYKLNVLLISSFKVLHIVS